MAHNILKNTGEITHTCILTYSSFYVLNFTFTKGPSFATFGHTT